MKPATTVLQMLVRITGVIQLVLGVFIWTGNFDYLISYHIVSGSVLVLSLLGLAILAARAGVQPGLVAVAIIWAIVLPILGLTQAGLLPGGAHWVIQVVHLLLGVGAIGLSETLARRMKLQLPATSAAPSSR